MTLVVMHLVQWLEWHAFHQPLRSPEHPSNTQLGRAAACTPYSNPQGSKTDDPQGPSVDQHGRRPRH